MRLSARLGRPAPGRGDARHYFRFIRSILPISAIPVIDNPHFSALRRLLRLDMYHVAIFDVVQMQPPMGVRYGAAEGQKTAAGQNAIQ